MPTPQTADQRLSWTTEHLAGNRLSYRMVSTWRVRGTLEEVVAILRCPDGYSRWWPSVFLSTSILQRGDNNEVGTRVAVVTKGWLPYTLHFAFEVRQSDPRDGVEVVARGDFNGVGRIRGVETAEGLEMTMDWQCEVQRPLLRVLARLAHRLGVSNHRWTMRQGCRSLQAELDRRRAGASEARGVPGPVFPHDRFTQRVLGLPRG